MIDALALVLTVGCLGVGLVVLAQAASGSFRRRRLSPTLGLLQLTVVVQAGLDVVGLARGHRPQELTTHLAYLGVSLLLVPVAAAETRGDDGRWSGVLIAVAVIVLAVVVVRMQTTWRAAR